MSFQFNPEYDEFVAALPPYMLRQIKVAIEKKYNQGDTNDDIDDIFKEKADQVDSDEPKVDEDILPLEDGGFGQMIDLPCM